MSVPVLSELIAEVEPSVSVDCIRFMIAPTRASSCVPYARIVVTTAGRFSGIAPTANATAAVNTTVKVSPRARFERHRDDQRDPGDPQDLVGQPVELAGQRGLGGLLRLQHPGDVPDLGRHPGGGDDELAGTRG